MKKELAYPRILVHQNAGGSWALAWRFHNRCGYWDRPVYAAPHFLTDQLPAAYDEAAFRVASQWSLLGRHTP